VLSSRTATICSFRRLFGVTLLRRRIGSTRQQAGGLKADVRHHPPSNQFPRDHHRAGPRHREKTDRLNDGRPRHRQGPPVSPSTRSGVWVPGTLPDGRSPTSWPLRWSAVPTSTPVTQGPPRQTFALSSGGSPARAKNGVSPAERGRRDFSKARRHPTASTRRNRPAASSASHPGRSPTLMWRGPKAFSNRFGGGAPRWESRVRAVFYRWRSVTSRGVETSRKVEVRREQVSVDGLRADPPPSEAPRAACGVIGTCPLRRPSGYRPYVSRHRQAGGPGPPPDCSAALAGGGGGGAMYQGGALYVEPLWDFSPVVEGLRRCGQVVPGLGSLPCSSLCRHRPVCRR